MNQQIDTGRAATPMAASKVRKPHITIPTDHQVLECIFATYLDAFLDFDDQKPSRVSVNHVSVDVRAIAAKLKTDPELLFGRLYYYLDQKHRYKQENDVLVHLFLAQFGSGGHTVHFPFLSAILAQYREEHVRGRWTFRIAIASLITSLLAIGAQVFGGA